MLRKIMNVMNKLHLTPNIIILTAFNADIAAKYGAPVYLQKD